MTHHVGPAATRVRPRRWILPLAALAAAVLGVDAPSSAQTSGLKGSAYGYFAEISLFGGPQPPTGPTPEVTLPEGGSATPVTASAPSGTAQYGPATIFSSGPIEVSTQGTTGSVTSSATIATINTSESEVFTASNASSTCKASEAGLTGSATITNGTLRTSEGDPNVDGDDTVVTIPTDPPPNTSYDGVIEGVGDSFTYVFNEQVTNPDGSLTVYAAHLYLKGPTAVGDLFIGETVCGLAAAGSTATTAASTATTARSTTTTPPPLAKTGVGDWLPALAVATTLLVVGGEVARRRARQGHMGQR